MRGLRLSTFTSLVTLLLRGFSSPGSGSMEASMVFTPAGPALNSTDSVCSTPSPLSVTSREARTFPPSLSVIFAREPP
jgi:hypothetical protein